MFCWKGSWKIYFIYFATIYVKLKELNFITGKVKTSKIVLEQGVEDAYEETNQKRKRSFFFQIGSKFQKLTNMLFIK